MKTVCVGVIGAGFMGQKAHLESLARIPDVEITALAEGRPQTSLLTARRFGIKQDAVYPDHRALLKQAEVDAVVCALDYRLHHQVVRDVLDAGKHCFSEKPIACRVETGQTLDRIAKEHGLIYQIGYMKRFLGVAQRVRETVHEWKRSGQHGPISYLRVTMPHLADWIQGLEPPLNGGDSPVQYQGQEMEPFPSWMNPKQAEVYNWFINFYVHQLNLVRFFIGEDFSVDYVDPSGMVIAFRSIGGAPIVLEAAAYGSVHDWDEYYKICFESGKIDLRLPAPMNRQDPGHVRIGERLEDSQPHWFSTEPEMSREWAFFLQMEHFVDCVRTRSISNSPASEAIKDLEVAEQYVRNRFQPQ